MSVLGPTKTITPTGDLTIRRATVTDAGALERLAHLDSARVPQGTVLLAEVAGVPWAAVSIDDLHVVADPFRPSADVVLVLLERARQLRRGHRRSTRRRVGWRPAFG